MPPTKLLPSPDAVTRLRSHARPSHPSSQVTDLVAILSVAATVVVMAYSFLLGEYGVLLFYILWFPPAALRSKRLREGLRINALPAVYIGFCILSVLWSDYPLVTGRAAVEAASMVICTTIICQYISLINFVKGLKFGLVIILLITLRSNTHGIDSLDHTQALVGLFGSKNVVGFFAELGIFVSAISILCSRTRWRQCLRETIPLAISIVCLFMCKSATSLVSLAAVFACYWGVHFLRKLPAKFRGICTVAAVFLIAAALPLCMSLGLQDAGLSLLGKDSTLTGRTYLWSQGLKIGLQHPLLGHGFSAFWVQGRPEAESLWFQFDVLNRYGFHFHETFIQAFVDIGIIGDILLVALYVRNLVAKSPVRFTLRFRPDRVFHIRLNDFIFRSSFCRNRCIWHFRRGSALVFFDRPLFTPTEYRISKISSYVWKFHAPSFGIASACGKQANRMEKRRSDCEENIFTMEPLPCNKRQLHEWNCAFTENCLRSQTGGVASPGVIPSKSINPFLALPRWPQRAYCAWPFKSPFCLS